MLPKSEPAQYSLSDYNFLKLSKRESNGRARIRLLILHQYSLGKSTSEIAPIFGFCSPVTRKVRQRYESQGLDSIYDKPRSGRPSRLALEHYDAFKALLIQERSSKGDRLTLENIIQLADSHFGALYTRSGIFALLQRIDLSWVMTTAPYTKGSKDDNYDEVLYDYVNKD